MTLALADPQAAGFMSPERTGQILAVRGLQYFPDDPTHGKDGSFSPWNFNTNALRDSTLLREASVLMVAHAAGLGLKYQALAHNRRDETLGTAFAINAQRDVSFVSVDQHAPAFDRFRGPDLPHRRNTLLVSPIEKTGRDIEELAGAIGEKGAKVQDALVLIDQGHGQVVERLGKLGINCHVLYELDDATGFLRPTSQLIDNLFKLQEAERHQVREAVLGVGVLKLGRYRFADGQESDNKIDMEEIYKHSRVLRLVLQALGKLAIPYRPDCIVPIANGADQLGVHLGVWLDLPVAFLKKDRVEPGLKTFLFRTEGDEKLALESANIIMLEDAATRRTSTSGALQIPILRRKTRAVLEVWDRAAPGEARPLPVPEHVLVKEALPYSLPKDHHLRSYAVPDPDPEQQKLAATRAQ